MQPYQGLFFGPIKKLIDIKLEFSSNSRFHLIENFWGTLYFPL